MNVTRYLIVAVSAAFVWSTAGQDAHASIVVGVCGDGSPDTLEACDDGNTVAGDGCSASCRIEAGFTCTAAMVAQIDNAVSDGGFEADQDAWLASSERFGTPLCDAGSCGAGGTWAAASGTNWLWLGGATMPEVAAVQQSLVIERGDSTLSFVVGQPACDSVVDVAQVSIDGNVVFSVNGADASCGTISYRGVDIDLGGAPGGPYNDGLAHTLRIEAQTLAQNGRETSFFFDDFVIARGTAEAQPSVCTYFGNVCEVQSFDPPLAGDLGAIGWTTFVHADSATGTMWGTTDDGVCGSANGTPGNFTGASLSAACIDSDASGVGITDAYLCSTGYDLTGRSGTMLTLRANYHPFGPADSDDRFDILAGNLPPSANTIGTYTLIQASQGAGLGSLFEPPGESLLLDLQAFDNSGSLFVCLRYRGDFDWSAQVDDVTLRAANCTGADTDGDGVQDALDNCTRRNNPLQLDSNQDGIGNACDQDISGPAGIGSDDCVVNALDLAALRAAFGTTPMDANWNPHADFAGVDGPPDGQINAIDLGRMRSAFFSAPGPSATGCQP